MGKTNIILYDGTSVVLQDGILTIKRKKDDNVYVSDTLERFTLLYWKEWKNGNIYMTITHDMMPEPFKIQVRVKDGFVKEAHQLHEAMIQNSNIDLKTSVFSTIVYKTENQKEDVTEKKKRQMKNVVKATSEISDNLARCPRCGSASLSANKKGFGMGKAVVGTLAFGVIGGALAGSIGAKKIEVTCLKCGKKFKV